MNSSGTAIYFGLIDDKTYTILDTTFSCFLVNIIAILGVVGNIFNVIILSYHGMDNSTNIVLMSLSVLDLFYDLATLVQKIRCVLSTFSEPLAFSVEAYYVMYLALFVRCTGCISSTHIVLISIERLLAVYLPMTVSKMFTLKRTYVYLAVMYLCWLIIYAPFFPAYVMREVFDNSLQTSVVTIIRSPYFVNAYPILGYVNIVIIAGFRGPGFLVIIMAASAATSYKLYDAGRKRLKMTSSERKFDVKAVKMLLAVCLVYLALGIPACIPVMLYYFDENQLYIKNKQYTSLYKLFENLKDFLYVTNASVNFLIYILMSKKFSGTFHMLIRKCSCMRKFAGEAKNQAND